MSLSGIKNNFLKIFQPSDEKSNEKEYLLSLADNLETAQKAQKNVRFTIKEIKEKGFSVKVGGLFAFIPFNHMPWHYNSVDYWKSISKYLIDKSFYCKIHQIKRNPISILIDGQIQQFKTIQLIEHTEYKGIIVNKAKYGLFIDIGYNFGWECGSFVGLIHKSNFKNQEDYEKAEAGDEITTFFHTYTEDGKIILGDDILQKEWLTGELNDLIGTTQKVKVTFNEENKRQFYVQDKYRASLPVTKSMYPDDKEKIKSKVEKLMNNDLIECEIVGINKKKKAFILKLSNPDVSRH